MTAQTMQKPERIIWLDIARTLCALMILGIHWLHAAYNAKLFGGDRPINLVMDYQGHSGGFRLFDYLLISGGDHSAGALTADLIGLLGGFGWEAVSALVLLSGFSLVLAQGGKLLSRTQWFAWFGKRAKRILVPFYIAAFTFLILYAIVALALPHVHGHFAAVIDAKLLSQFHTPPLGVILSHVILFDPYNQSWSADFFAPAWWFVPAILLAYVTYPFIRAASRVGCGVPLLIGSALVSVAAFLATNAGWLVNEQWYYIVLHESFDFSLGVVLGNMWLGSKRGILERAIGDGRVAAVVIAAFVAGNILNWIPELRPVADMMYGPALTVLIIALAKRLDGTWIADRLASVDSYDLYLVHQPFAFPIAILAGAVFHSYAVFVGWIIFVAVAALASKLLTLAQQRTFARRKLALDAAIAESAPQLPKPAGGKQFANVQGLRAIAAVMVFGLHLNGMEGRFTSSAFLNAFSPVGNWGVDLFFIISGFVMITSTWNNFAAPGISLRFFMRRLVRIYPPYFIVLLPIFALYLIAPGMVNASQDVKPNILASFLLLPQMGFGLLIVSWTLVYEMFFYVIFAAVLCFKRQYCLPLMFAWGAVTLAISALSHSLHNVYLETYGSPLMLEFIAGVLTGYLIKTRGVRFSIPLIVAGIACIVAADLYYPAFDAAYALGGYLRFLIVGVPMALIFAGVVGVEINYGRTFPAWLLVVGNASYSLYLWHEPLTVFAGRLSVRYEGLLHHSAMHAIWLAGVAAFVIGTSIALYYFVERPLLKFFSRRLDTVAVMRAPRAVPGL